MYICIYLQIHIYICKCICQSIPTMTCSYILKICVHAVILVHQCEHAMILTLRSSFPLVVQERAKKTPLVSQDEAPYSLSCFFSLLSSSRPCFVLNQDPTSLSSFRPPLFCFLSWVANTQLHHWTRWVASTQLASTYSGSFPCVNRGIDRGTPGPTAIHAAGAPN